MALSVNISKRFSGFTLDAALEADGGCLGILGASGCGKSMTLKCIAGIEKPDSGTIVLNGRVLFDAEKKINLPPRERHVGYLFQNYALFPTMTVEENLLVVMPGKKKANRSRVLEQLDRFHLDGLEGRYPSQLSGGQQQRVAFARMLLSEPEIIMLDEPFSALDGFLKDVLQLEVQEIIREYSGDVLLVSHSRDEIFKFCDRMALLSEGRCILQGRTAEIFARPGLMEAARLTGCKNISAIEKTGAHELYAIDWGMCLHTAEEISEEIRYAGIRGHWLRPADGPGENVMRTALAGYTETPFEHQYLFSNADAPGAQRIWWMQSKRDFSEEAGSGLPPYIHFPKEQIMLLTAP